ncbi:protein TIC 40, chloroplastic-like isoform X2 [Cucurbita pepo subsp. pepo]|uniref:protein TIC 40, chloroplastic-like isoform X2 n=1 Tax=Cucurbita pepo subsp. pepo TaxID=3664 RepID=UPI000C9D2D81|nr:protein TIC 40, chloroplastic-like isoform X2 [Cucurbita pepo subsp. pepo]
MDRLNLALTSSPKFVFLGYSSTSSISTPTRTNQLCGSRRLASSRIKYPPRILASAVNRRSNHRIVVAERFASVSSSTTSNESSSVGVPSVSAPPPSSYVGSPLFWVGVGVGLSALFTWVASYLKKYAMQQAFKTMMSQMNSQNTPMSNSTQPFGSPFPVPPTFATGTAVSPSVSETAASIDVTATKVEDEPVTNVKSETENMEAKKFAFVDVSPEETDQKSPFKEEATDTDVSKSAQPPVENGAASKQAFNGSEGSQFSRKSGKTLSVEAVEKMMEDPTVQKMIYPHLPEEMRNPETFKWMMQNPLYRQQLEEMLNNMSGSPQWDDRLMDSLKNFDLSSPEVKQQFDQIGMTPEEVISKMMANPEIAMAFQNPRVQAAIMDCSQNPLSITKYQNDKEVMDVFNKISELFPGVSGAP